MKIMSSRRSFLKASASLSMMLSVPLAVSADPVNYAEVLSHMLSVRGVMILPVDRLFGVAGAKMGDRSSQGGLLFQRHVDGLASEFRLKHIEALADNLASHSALLRFAPLFIPTRPDVGATRMEAGNVTLRLLTTYQAFGADDDPYVDQMITRLDVLFCDARREV